MSCGEPEIIQSQVSQDHVVCPSCGNVDQVDVWDRIEATCNPERTAQLATGELLVHACSKCGTLAPLDYPLFFIDRDKGNAVYYPAGEGDIEALRTAFTQLLIKFRGVELSSLGKREFEVRVAEKRHQLVEKVAVWQAGLNDKVMELFKATLLRELSSRYPDRTFVDAQFNGVVGKGTPSCAIDLLLFTSDETAAPMGIKVPFAAYRGLAQDLDIRTAVDRHRSPIVNAEWSREVLDDASKLRAGAAQA